MSKKIHQSIARIILYIVENIVTRLPYTDFTSRLIDKLIVASEK